MSIKKISQNATFFKEYRLFSPELRHQKNDHCIDFKPAQEHAPDQQPFTHGGNPGIVTHRTDKV